MTTDRSIHGLMAIEGLLSPEERAIRDEVRAFVDDRFRPRLQQAHRERAFPVELLPELGALGVFGANLSGYGCAGLNNVAYGLVLQELERGDSGLRSTCSVQGSLVMYPIYRFGAEAQKERWLPALATGRSVGCFGLTEPGSGSDPGSMTTRATQVDGGYRLNGIKTWITNSPIADVAVVWAKVTDDHDTIRGFLVERGTLGFSTPEIEGKLSLLASPTGEIHLNDCFVPAENILPESSGLRSPLECLNQARYGIGWGAIGAALDCFETALRYGMERQQFGRPLASFQLFQEKLAELATQITLGQVLALHFGRQKDQGTLSPEQVSLLKRNNVRVARDAARETRAMLGANGVSDAYSPMRHLMNLESVYTYEGTHDVHTLALGRALTGLNAFF